MHKLDYLRSTLNELQHQKVIQVSRVAAIRQILGPLHYQFDTDISEGNSRPLSKRMRGMPISKADLVSSRPKKLAPASKTFLTLIVNRIAKDLFKGSLEVAKSDYYEDDHRIVSVKRRQHKAHHTDPAKIIWGERVVGDEDIYSSVIVDGVTYRVSRFLLFSAFSDVYEQRGDVVMVEPDGDDQTNTSRASQTVNRYGNRWW
jgi:DNA (cytosine-5)-methyltransferase 1